MFQHRTKRALLITFGLFFVAIFSLLFSKQPAIGGNLTLSSHVGPTKGLIEDDFRPQASSSEYLDVDDLNRYESVESWRSSDTFSPTYPPANPRPMVPHWSKYKSKGQYLKQPLVADYANGSENIFLMIKTGGDVLWERLPIHLVTTLTRVPNFALYSDKPGSVGGYQVIDILAIVTDETLKLAEFEKYTKMKYLHNNHRVADASNMKIDGGWELDKYKNIPMLAHAYSVSPKSDWFVFMDADTYIFMDVMTRWLSGLNPEEILYMGLYMMYGDLPFAYGGGGVVLSRKALEETVGKHPEYVEEYEKLAVANCCGDVLVAEMIQNKTGVGLSYGPDYPYVDYRFQGSSFSDFFIRKENWCSQIQTFHHLNSHEIEILYEYERLRGPYRDDITYYDMYRDFYLPYIDEKKEHWDNFANEFEWTNETTKRLSDEAVVPYESFQGCKRACEEAEWCLAFRYIPDRQYCGLDPSIRLGQPVLDWSNESDDDDQNTYEDVTSGFMISRIREFRKTQQCDFMDSDEKEGWFAQRIPSEARNNGSGQSPAAGGKKGKK